MTETVIEMKEKQVFVVGEDLPSVRTFFSQPMRFGKFVVRRFSPDAVAEILRDGVIPDFWVLSEVAGQESQTAALIPFLKAWTDKVPLYYLGGSRSKPFVERLGAVFFGSEEIHALCKRIQGRVTGLVIVK